MVFPFIHVPYRLNYTAIADGDTEGAGEKGKRRRKGRKEVRNKRRNEKYK